MTDQEIANGLVLSWMSGESYEDWKERYIEDYLPDEPLPSDESLVHIYREDCRFEWECLIGELDTLLEDRFSGYWWVKAENFGWQSVHGTAEFFADTGQKFLQELLPKTECYFKVFLHEQWTHRVDYVGESHLFKGLSIQNYHHDSPVGNEWYYLLDVGDLTKCVRCEKWFPEMEYYEYEGDDPSLIGSHDDSFCQRCGEAYYEENEDATD